MHRHDPNIHTWTQTKPNQTAPNIHTWTAPNQTKPNQTSTHGRHQTKPNQTKPSTGNKVTCGALRCIMLYLAPVHHLQNQESPFYNLRNQESPCYNLRNQESSGKRRIQATSLSAARAGPALVLLIRYLLGGLGEGGSAAWSQQLSGGVESVADGGACSSGQGNVARAPLQHVQKKTQPPCNAACGEETWNGSKRVMTVPLYANTPFKIATSILTPRGASCVLSQFHNAEGQVQFVTRGASRKSGQLQGIRHEKSRMLLACTGGRQQTESPSEGGWRNRCRRVPWLRGSGPTPSSRS